MKTILSTISLLACTAASLVADAQSPTRLWDTILTTPSGITPDPGAPVVLHPYQAQLLKKAAGMAPNAKTTATASRLISSSTLKSVNFVFTYVDSTVYAYSGGRGSDLTSEPGAYDSYSQHVYNSGTAQFSPGQRGIYTYNAADKMTDALGQAWDIPTQTWRNTSHSVNTYDAQNNNLSRLSQEWDVNTAAWKNEYLTSYTYDGLGQMTSYVFQSWDVNTVAWKNFSQQLLTYNGTLLETMVSKSWVANAWKPDQRHEYTYDAANRVVNHKRFLWDVNSASWKANINWVYTYTASGDVQTYQEMTWNAQTAVYDPAYLTSYTYTPAGKVATELRQHWNGNFWVSSNRYTYGYDAQDRETSETSENWVVNTNSWKPASGRLQTYNADNLPSIVTYQLPDTNNVLQNKTRTLYEYNSWGQVTRSDGQTRSGGIWFTLTADRRYNHRYEDYQSTGVGKTTNLDANIRIFPNPAADYIRVTAQFAKPETATVIITDAMGRIAQRTVFTSTQSLNDVVSVATLPAGLYSVTLRTTGGQHSQALSVVK